MFHKSIILGKWGYHRQGSCQAGLGAAIANVSKNVLPSEGKILDHSLNNPYVNGVSLTKEDLYLKCSQSLEQKVG